ncbi:transmembrane protein 107 isoform X2 [Tupaia chinensis]|uniref:transmembrane protein 107 isoform X2 n=1 Tax=Tupaia chinensis TaxID=246437 RepID=UPI000FFC8B96|nr:transmembrane protein 107 isoform X2 [Tupaia chinensis]
MERGLRAVPLPAWASGEARGVPGLGQRGSVLAGPGGQSRRCGVSPHLRSGVQRAPLLAVGSAPMGTTVAPLARRSIELASLLLSRDFQRTWSLSRITKATGRRLSRREGGVCRDFARLPWSLQASSLRDHGLRSGQCPCPPRAMGRVSGLVPSRFLTLLAHLVVVITLFWSRCLPSCH